MRFRDIFFIFILFRAVDSLIAYLSPHFIPYLGFFPYKEIAAQYNLPKFLTSLANFDGTHYLLIAKNGYAQYQQAFFPLYPLLIRFLSPIFLNNYLSTALIISNIAFLLGLWIFSKYLIINNDSGQVFDREAQTESAQDTEQSRSARMTKQNKIILPLILLMAFPTSFFFGAVYTEGLFFFLFIGTLYFLKKDNYYLAALFAFLASLTRLIGLFLIIFFILKFISNFKLKIKNFGLFVAVFSPLLGLFLYSLYLWQTTGDPLFFLNSQWAFGAHRTSSLVFLPHVYFRYLKIFFTAQWNFQYFISLFEFSTFTFVFLVVILNLFQDLKMSFWGVPIKSGRLQNRSLKQRFRIHPEDSSRGTRRNDEIGLELFSLVNLLLPTLTGTLSSIPRYALFSLSFFIYISKIKNLLIKSTILVVFLIFHILMLGFFVQGYFVS